MNPILLRLGLLLALLWPASPALAADDSKALILVAKRNLQGPYGSTVLLARPLDAGRHVGVIVNKPTQMRLGALFPNHEPSRKIADPVFLGGPMGSEVIFALVQRKDSPGNRSLQIAPGLYLATDSSVVDRIIESEPTQARFFAGVVVWQTGELREELRRGMWFVQEPRSEVVLRKSTEGMWEEMVNRLERAAKMI
jgi:putative transcriptional regulator